jgi:hypothetical protein
MTQQSGKWLPSVPTVEMREAFEDAIAHNPFKAGRRDARVNDAMRWEILRLNDDAWHAGEDLRDGNHRQLATFRTEPEMREFRRRVVFEFAYAAMFAAAPAAADPKDE